MILLEPVVLDSRNVIR